MRIFCTSVILLLLSMTLSAQEQPKSETQGQPGSQREVIVLAPLPERITHPQAVPALSLHRALKFAEKYLKKEGATLSRLHLIQAEFVFVGDEKNPAPSWHLKWRTKGSTSFLGFDAELYVFMNGHVWDPPVM